MRGATADCRGLVVRWRLLPLPHCVAVRGPRVKRSRCGGRALVLLEVLFLDVNVRFLKTPFVFRKSIEISLFGQFTMVSNLFLLLAC